MWTALKAEETWQPNVMHERLLDTGSKKIKKAQLFGGLLRKPEYGLLIRLHWINFQILGCDSSLGVIQENVSVLRRFMLKVYRCG